MRELVLTTANIEQLKIGSEPFTIIHHQAQPALRVAHLSFYTTTSIVIQNRVKPPGNMESAQSR